MAAKKKTVKKKPGADRARHVRMLQFCIALALALFGLPWLVGTVLAGERTGRAEVVYAAERERVVDALTGPAPLTVLPGEGIEVVELRALDENRTAWVEVRGQGRCEIEEDRGQLPDRYAVRLVDVGSGVQETTILTLTVVEEGTHVVAEKVTNIPWKDWRGPYQRFAIRFLGGPTFATRNLLLRLGAALDEPDAVVR